MVQPNRLKILMLTDFDDLGVPPQVVRAMQITAVRRLTSPDMATRPPEYYPCGSDDFGISRTLTMLGARLYWTE